jgi:hypothetical protein
MTSRRRGSAASAPAGNAQERFGEWQWPADYAARDERGEPRGRNKRRHRQNTSAAKLRSDPRGASIEKEDTMEPLAAGLCSADRLIRPARRELRLGKSSRGISQQHVARQSGLAAAATHSGLLSAPYCSRLLLDCSIRRPFFHPPWARRLGNPGASLRTRAEQHL